ncbi:hypothetical protein BCR35DRAFT_305382 [Leucosporidium creatinivorum]|uniref:Uncharacterized protein n=1 Tax=Leucosporidium creatinivorum TaxID=106004 RepID=A0A1Y2F197_9BASI|nr:hypothetical protein BCR35DRAFT_305382 [Leucosporidium creatinivorum]
MSSYLAHRSALDTPYLRPVSLPDRSLAMSPLPLGQEGSMLNEAEHGDWSWLGMKTQSTLRSRRCWGLQMDLGDEAREKEPTFPSPELQAPPSPPASPTSASRIPTALNGDGARVLRRRRSLSATSPPPSPTRRIKQRFGVGDGEDEDLPPLPPFIIPTPTSSYSPLFPLSPILTTPLLPASPPPFSLPPTLHRSTSLSRLLAKPSPLRRRSTTAMFRPSTPHVPELQLSRSSSDTKGKRVASGWRRELGVLGEEIEGRWVGFEVDGSSTLEREISYGWSGGADGTRRLTITNPDDGLSDEEADNVKDDQAQDAMETDDHAEVGLAL